MPREKDDLKGPELLRVPPTTDEERQLAASYVASRAKALGWTREQHETTLLALFEPPSTRTDWERGNLPRLDR
jgi:hypothetical protein